MTGKLKYAHKILILGQVPFQQLHHYTKCAAIGISAELTTNLNYIYSLPNKVFDYIQAGVPILATKLVEVEQLINTYQVGKCLTSNDPYDIAKDINSLLQDEKLWSTYRDNCLKAAKILNWSNENQKIISLFNVIFKK